MTTGRSMMAPVDLPAPDDAVRPEHVFAVPGDAVPAAPPQHRPGRRSPGPDLSSGAAPEAEGKGASVLDIGRWFLDRARMAASDQGLTDALHHLERAAALGAAGPEAERLGADLHRRLVPRWHFAMLNDGDRNAAFARALDGVDLAGRVVLDIGTGSGLLAMMAAARGAAWVVTCEAVAPIARTARQIIAANGLADRIEVVDARSDDPRVAAALPRPADVLVTETVDCGLIGEGLLATLAHARRHLLAPDAVLIPRRARLWAQPIESPVIHALNHVTAAGGFDVRAFDAFATVGHFPCRVASWPHRWLGPAVPVAAFDFAADPPAASRHAAALPIAEAGSVHAVMFWFDLEVADGVVLTNAPEAAASHWMQAVHTVRIPLPAAAGTVIDLDLQLDDTALVVALDPRG